MVKGNKAVWECIFEGVTRDSRKLEIPGVCVYEFSGEKIQQHRAFYDRVSMGKKAAKGWLEKKIINAVASRRARSGAYRASFFGINIESVYPIRNILKGVNVDKLLDVFSSLPSDITVWLGERPTRKDKRGTTILDRQKEASTPIEGSVFAEKDVPACDLTKKELEEEIIERIRKLNGYVHLLIDKKLWDLDKTMTKGEYFEKMLKAREVLDELYKTLDNWSGMTP